MSRILQYHIYNIELNIIFKINELDLLWVLNFIALGIYFTFRTKFFWNEGTDTCFNVECVLFGRNSDYFGSYFVVTTRYLVVTARYLMVTGGYRSLLVVTANYRSFPLLVWTSIFLIFSDLSLNIFLGYSYFSRSALLLTISEKSHSRKNYISSKIKQ